MQCAPVPATLPQCVLRRSSRVVLPPPYRNPRATTNTKQWFTTQAVRPAAMAAALHLPPTCTRGPLLLLLHKSRQHPPHHRAQLALLGSGVCVLHKDTPTHHQAAPCNRSRQEGDGAPTGSLIIHGHTSVRMMHTRGVKTVWPPLMGGGAMRCHGWAAAASGRLCQGSQGL
jgi:hypothetical protein